LAVAQAPPGTFGTWKACFRDTGTYHHVAPEPLAAIAHAESGLVPTALHRNADGSRDIGLMQVNTRYGGVAV
jgi:soluble lytic murein transglycosylase-like protein